MRHLGVLLLFCTCLEARKYNDFYFGDLLPAGTEFVEGGGAKQHSEQFAKHGDKGAKGYKSFHEQEKGQKGKVEKALDSGHYGEESGNKKNFHHDDGYYAEHEKRFEATKGGKYYEEEKFAKGHSTKGSHDVHDLDEFKKNTDFFDEDEDSGYSEHHGGSSKQHSREKGGHDKSGSSQASHHSDGYDKKGHSKNGSHFNKHKGNKASSGLEQHHANHAGFGNSDGQEDNRQWKFLQ